MKVQWVCSIPLSLCFSKNISVTTAEDVSTCRTAGCHHLNRDALCLGWQWVLNVKLELDTNMKTLVSPLSEPWSTPESWKIWSGSLSVHLLCDPHHYTELFL